MLAGLANAGRIAKNKNPNYSIHVRSGFRPLKTQIRLVCDRFTAGDEKRIAKIGQAVAFPGGSNHGSGAAVDIQLWEGGKQLITMSYSAQNASKYEEPAKIFAEIMAEAGFVRYSKEIWHFELEGKASSRCRCRGSACPFPPKC
jgi:D-alanyl-D-alanine dipeptidase